VKRLPGPADVRAAIADLRRPHEARARARWSRAGSAICRFCGEEASCLAPGSDPSLTVCDQTIGEMHVAVASPAIPGALLETIDRWMPPGDPAPAAGDAPPERCSACGRPGAEAPRIVAGVDAALCSDCIASALPLADEAIVAHCLANESEQAMLELDDLDRLEKTEPPKRLRSNPTLALSLVRLLSVPDERVAARLAAAIERLDRD
jgi:hypothetical protein